MTRAQLKQLVRECLMELLADAASAGSAASGDKPDRRRADQRVDERAQAVPRRALMNRDVVGLRVALGQPPVESLALKRIATGTEKKLVTDRSGSPTVTADPLIAQILADTATTTLVEQASAGHGGRLVVGSGAASVASSDAVPSADQSKWAYLAFTEPVKRRAS